MGASQNFDRGRLAITCGASPVRFMKKIKYNVCCYNTGITSTATEKVDKDLIKILVNLGKGIDSEGYGDGDYDAAIHKIKKLFIK